MAIYGLAVLISKIIQNSQVEQEVRWALVDNADGESGDGILFADFRKDYLRHY